MAPRRCPTHPTMPYDDCGFCEAKIIRQELHESDPPPDWELGQDRYERQLEDRLP